MLKTRVLVGAIGLPILVAVVLIGTWVFALAVLAVLIIGAEEYVRLWRHRESHPPEWLIAALIVLALGATWFEKAEWWQPGLSLLLAGGMLWAIWRMEHGDPRSVPDVALATLGGVYIGWLGSRLIAVRMLDDGAYLTLFLYGCVIVSDSAAFFIGRTWGRRRLSPTVSPKKSWEGYLAGIVAGTIFGALAGGLPGRESLSAGHGAIIGLLIGILGTVGDLAVSVIKRQTGAKDSSRLIPGHGGILDRIDSVLVAALIGYYYLVWFVS